MFENQLLKNATLSAIVQAFRFGVQEAEALKAVDMAFELAPAPRDEVYKGAMKTLALVRVLPLSTLPFVLREGLCHYNW